MKNKNNLNVLKEENDKRKYFMLDIYGGYNKQELMASDIEVYAKTEKDAMKEAIKIFKDEYDYDPEENQFGLKAVITSSDLDEEIDTKELDETLPETFEGKIDFLAADEEEAIEGYDKVLLALDGDEYVNVRKQLEIIRDEEVAHKEFLEKVKTDLDTIYVDPNEEKDKEEEIVDLDTETDESLKEECMDFAKNKFLKEDLEDDCREKAEEQLKNSNNFAAIYGYTTHGKFFCLPAVRLCKDEESLKANTEAVKLRYHPQGSIRVAYKNDTLEDSWKYKDHMYNALEEEDLEDTLYDKRSK